MTVESPGGDKEALERLEGMIIAHRQTIALLITQVAAHFPELLTAMEDRRVLRDGQEDPGAVPTEGLALELALAEEMTRIRNTLEVMRAG